MRNLIAILCLEGFPSVLFRVMPSGLSALATYCGSDPVKFLNKRFAGLGLLALTGNVVAIIEGVLRLACDQAQSEPLGSQAPTEMERYSVSRVGRQWHDLSACLYA